MLTDDLEIHFIELPKFDLAPERLTTGAGEQWCYFLKHGEELDTDNLPAALDAPAGPASLGDTCSNAMSRNDHEARVVRGGRLKQAAGTVTCY